MDKIVTKEALIEATSSIQNALNKKANINEALMNNNIMSRDDLNDILKSIGYNIYEHMYLTLSIIQKGHLTWTVSNDYSCYYRINKGSWIKLTYYQSIYLKPEDIIEFKGNLNKTFSIFQDNNNITYNAYGNPLSLIFNDNFDKVDDEDLLDKKLSYLFQSKSVIDAHNLYLDPRLVATECYKLMFSNAKKLVYAPDILNERLGNDACYGMFWGCSSLLKAPKIMTTTLGNNCFADMFNACTSLTEMPELPATTLAFTCYSGMFQNCTKLKVVHDLPATTLCGGCYRSMFAGCTALRNAPRIYCTSFSDTTPTNGACQEMFRGCTSLEKAPELLATDVSQAHAYQLMFSDCTKLSIIKCHAETFTGTNCLTGWLYNASTTGTFYKVEGITYSEGTSGIPSGWNVELLD